MFGAERNSTFLSFCSTSGDVWHYPRWEPVGRCLWTPWRVLGSLLASYTHVTQHTSQPPVGAQSGLHGALTVSCCHSGEIPIKMTIIWARHIFCFLSLLLLWLDIWTLTIWFFESDFSGLKYEWKSSERQQIHKKIKNRFTFTVVT